MPVDIRMDDEFPDAAWLLIREVVTWEDYHRDIDQILEFVVARGQPTDLILVTPAGFPKGNPLPHMRTAYQRVMKEPNLRRMLVIERSGNRLATMLFYVLVRIGLIDAKRFIRVASADAARDVLRSSIAI